MEKFRRRAQSGRERRAGGGRGLGEIRKNLDFGVQRVEAEIKKDREINREKEGRGE